MQQLATESASVAPATAFAPSETPAAREARYAQYKIIRRNGSVVGFEPSNCGERRPGCGFRARARAG
jgi:hypothetical protein